MGFLIIWVYRECDMEFMTVAESHHWPRVWQMCPDGGLSCCTSCYFEYDIYVALVKHFTTRAFPPPLTLSHNPIIIRRKCQLIFCTTKDMNKENHGTQNFVSMREVSWLLWLHQGAVLSSGAHQWAVVLQGRPRRGSGGWGMSLEYRKKPTLDN